MPAELFAGLTPRSNIVRILTIVCRRPNQAAEGGPDRDRAATLQLVIALARAYQALEQGTRTQMAEHGLGTTEFAVLEVLYHKGALPLGEIRDRILVTGASTTYVVKKLEERGLLRRRACAEDQRVVFGELTAKGNSADGQALSRPRRAPPGADGAVVRGGETRGGSAAAPAQSPCAPHDRRADHGRRLSGLKILLI